MLQQRTGAGVPLLLLLLLCQAARLPAAVSQPAAPAITECNDGLPATGVATCGQECRIASYRALISLYNILAVKYPAPWVGVYGDQWGRCDECWVSNQTLEGNDGTFNRTASAGAQRLPAYCCWRGVICCGEFHAFEPASVLLQLINSTPNGARLVSNLTLVAQVLGTSLPMLQQPTCSTYGVTGLTFSQFHMNATFSDTLPDLITLHDLGLLTIEWQTNQLAGTLPPQLGRLSKLNVLNLGNNYLSGTVPAELNNMTELTELNLQFNSLQGPLRQALCQNKSSNSLQALWLRGNNFTGPIDLSKCVQLRLVDLQDNSFSGPLPVSIDNAQVNILRLRNNFFTGSFGAVYYMRYLGILDLTNNSFSGNISTKISNNEYLITLNLGNNSLTGSIPEELTYLTSVGRLDLSQNRLIGTLPDMGGMLGLQFLYVGGNNINGTIPPSLGNLPYLEKTDLSYTLMTCCNTSSSAPTSYSDAVAMLQNSTPFLQFASEAASPLNFNAQGVRFADNARIDYQYSPHLRCYPVQRNRTVPPNTKVLVPSDLSIQIWTVGPEYFWFQTCHCEAGYTTQWTSTSSAWVDCPTTSPHEGACLAGFQVPVCVPESTLLRTVLVAIIIPLSVIALVIASYLICCRRVPKIYRTFFAVMKRYKGMPKRGPVSIVVTDIENYSDLMKSHPELMLKALSMHNAVIRKAKYTNIGYTLEQEGDSYLLAFHEPYDAVSFCLQAQQALNKVDWPKGLPGVSMTSKKNISGRQKRQSNPDGAPSTLFGSQMATKKWSMRAPFKQSDDDTVRHTVEEQAGSGSSGAALEEVAITSKPPSHSRLVDWLRSGQGAPAERQLFRGLRVRMGVATGELLEGQPVCSSAVFDRARVVSDAGCGGQILMDAPTFKGVKDSLHQLGATDANGLNYRKLSSKKTFLDRLCCRLPVEQDEALVLDMGEYQFSLELQRQGRPGSRVQGLKPSPQQQQQQGHTPPPAPEMPLFGTPLRQSLPYACGAGDEVPEPSTPGSSIRGGPDVVRLYQILAPALVGRAKVFGNRLSLKDDVACSDMPYFDAPGAMEAPLTPSRTPWDMLADFAQSSELHMLNIGAPQPSPAAATFTTATPSTAVPYGASTLSSPGTVAHVHAAAPPIPNVTMVFATVDNYKMLFKRRGGHGATVQRVLSALAREALRHVRGGYLCREQANPPKFMVAFSTPQAALEWCLIMQEASMYARWPLSVLLHKAFSEEYDEQGHLVFRGPRLKMGVCEGIPNTIMPDHIGRADYHGASINQAARYMDAAAHGGQVACELQLATKVLAAWRAKAQTCSNGDDAAAASLPGGPAGASSMRFDEGDEASLRPVRSSNDTSGLPLAFTSHVSSITANDAAGADTPPPAAPADGTATPQAGAEAAAPPSVPQGQVTGSAASTVQLQPAAPDGSLASIATRASSSPTPFAASAYAGEGSSTPRTQSADTYTPSAPSTCTGASFSSAVGSPPVQRAASASAAAAAQALSPSAASAPSLRHSKSARRLRHARPLIRLFRRGNSDPGKKRSEGSSASSGGSHFPGSIVAAVSELLHVRGPAAALHTSKSIPEESSGVDVDVAAGAAAQKHSGPQYALPNIPTTPTSVEVRQSGVYRFKGSAAPLEMVHVCTAAVSGRRYPADPPKGKGQRLEDRSGLVAAAVVPLPTLASEYLALFPKSMLWRAPAGSGQAAAAAANTRAASMTYLWQRRGASDTGTAGNDSPHGARTATSPTATAAGNALNGLRSQSSTAAASHAGVRRAGLSWMGAKGPPQLQLQPLQRRQQQAQQQQGLPMTQAPPAAPRTPAAPLMEGGAQAASADSHSVVIDVEGEANASQPAMPMARADADDGGMV